MDRQTEHIDELVEGYALRALPPDEYQRVEQHAAVCPPCRQQLRQTEDAAQYLAFATPAVAPPARCKMRVMEKIAREQFLATPSKPRRTVGSSPIWAAFAAVTLVLGMWSVSLQRDLSRTRAELAQAQSERDAEQTAMAQMQAQIALAQTERDTMQTQIAQLAGVETALQGDEVTRALQGQGVAADAVAVTYMKPGVNQALLVAKNLPPLPADKTYQVWVARDDHQQPLTTFKPVADETYVMIAPPEPMDTYTAIMVTVENTAGAQTPSDETVLAGRL
jgi:anti-sigma-K factor RskA